MEMKITLTKMGFWGGCFHFHYFKFLEFDVWDVRKFTKNKKKQKTNKQKQTNKKKRKKKKPKHLFQKLEIMVVKFTLLLRYFQKLDIMETQVGQ
jgi:hypothetical protein